MDNEIITVDERKPVAVAQNPLAMVADAVQRGTDPATIKALMDLAERYEANEARKAFVAALTEFKNNPPEIFKTKNVSFGGGKAAYKHATLADVSSIIGAALARVGISHRWETEQLDGGQIRVTCTLTHALGHSERTPLQASPDSSGSKNSIQAVGSTVTYLQRYTLLSATGMAVSDGTDDDARQGKKMADNAVADWIFQIEECLDEKEAANLWAHIAKATTAAGDVEAHEQLRSAMAAKRKALKAKPAKVEDEGL
jgi:hypothetical protein